MTRSETGAYVSHLGTPITLWAARSAGLALTGLCAASSGRVVHVGIVALAQLTGCVASEPFRFDTLFGSSPPPLAPLSTRIALPMSILPGSAAGRHRDRARLAEVVADLRARSG